MRKGAGIKSYKNFMKLLHRIALFIALVLPKQIRASITVNDTTLYQQVVDSLIADVVLEDDQMRLMLIFGKSDGFNNLKRPGYESLSKLVYLYAQGKIGGHTQADTRVRKNKELNMALSNAKDFVRNDFPLSSVKTSVVTRYKNDIWNVFRSYETANRFSNENPGFFFGLIDMTKPLYKGDYAIIIVDRRFSILGGDIYMHVFKKVAGRWQTYARVSLCDD